MFASVMPTPSAFLTFVAAALALLLMPGPAVLYIVARSMNQGRMAGVVSALGTTAGTLVHVLAAAIGLSAIILASATAFSVVKLLGAGYLMYLGVRTLLRREAMDAPAAPPRALRRLFSDGVLVSVLNPKTALFFLAFLPQFVDRARGPVGIQVAALGTTFAAMALCTDSAYALLAGTVRRWIGKRGEAKAWPRYVSGTIYLSLGVGTALAARRAHS